MNYHYRVFQLSKSLGRQEQAQLGARLRSFPGVISAVTEQRQLKIWYQGALPEFIMQLHQQAVKAGSTYRMPDMTAYRREAVISLASFTAMQILQRISPAIFQEIWALRSLLVLGIARNFIRNGLNGIFQEHRPNADTLTATAVIASVLAGKPESSLTLLALSNGAEMLTSYAAERTRKQISGLLNLNQRYVWLVENGAEKKVLVETIQAGNRIAVHTGEKICIDGKVLEGDAAVNQASITGESRPAMKSTGTPVYAGSVLEAGEIEVLVEKVGQDTSLARIVHLVEEAQGRRAPVQNFADNMANLLVPISFLGAAIVYGATRNWQRVLNLLFIDFSCGLKLSTATAISAAIGSAAKKGILVKGGNYIEALAEIDTIVLDKTGTLTLGVPQISFLRTTSGVTEKEMLLLAASAEQHSVHPLAVAVQKYVAARKWVVPQHKTSKTIVARGMQARIPDFDGNKGGMVLVGSYKFMQENAVTDLEHLAETTSKANRIYVARNKKLLGMIGIEDPIRPQMKKTLNQMRRYGIDEIVMLTGDSHEAAAEVARNMDIDAYHADVLPEDKANYVMKLKKQGRVMMVGDGINDAPALAFADVGVTLGGRQTDIAAESSAMTIHSDDPARLMEALRIGRRTIKIIHQNFIATITVNSAAMLLGSLGKINPLWAAVIHNTATLAVVLNSARILRITGTETRKTM